MEGRAKEESKEEKVEEAQWDPEEFQTEFAQNKIKRNYSGHLADFSKGFHPSAVQLLSKRSSARESSKAGRGKKRRCFFVCFFFLPQHSNQSFYYDCFFFSFSCRFGQVMFTRGVWRKNTVKKKTKQLQPKLKIKKQNRKKNLIQKKKKKKKMLPSTLLCAAPSNKQPALSGAAAVFVCIM